MNYGGAALSACGLYSTYGSAYIHTPYYIHNLSPSSHTTPPSLCCCGTLVYPRLLNTPCVCLHSMQLLSCGSPSLSFSPAAWHSPLARLGFRPCQLIRPHSAVNQSPLTYVLILAIPMQHSPTFVVKTHKRKQILNCKVSGPLFEPSAPMPLSTCSAVCTLLSAHLSFPVSVLGLARSYACM